jgi:hypothetical protein
MESTHRLRTTSSILMGFKWWHFRAAHIGYVDRETHTHITNRAGFEITNIKRTWWYFSGDYLWDRPGV